MVGQASPSLTEDSRRIKSTIVDWLGATAIVLLVALGIATPVPTGNELIYLPLLRRQADGSFLNQDWTFGSGFAEHAVFNHVLAPVVLLVGVEAVAWVGRFLAWLIIARLIIAIGRRLHAPVWASIASVAIFLGINQSMGVGAGFLFSHFEAKAVAWPLLLGALVAAWDRRVGLTALLVGLTFSFHPGVGLWGGGGLLAGMLLLTPTRSATARWIPVAGLASLPGLIPQVSSLLDSSMDAASAEFVALSRVPHHVDPLSFGERGPLILTLMVAFNLIWAWTNRDEYGPRLLGVYQAILMAIAVVGVVARLMEAYGVLLTTPFRVLPVLAPLLFLLTVSGWLFGGSPTWQVVPDVWRAGRMEQTMVITGSLALMALFVLWNPIPRWIDDVDGNMREWQSEPSSFDQTLSWVSESAPLDAVVAAPPWEDQIFYLSERAQLVSWGAIPFDRPQEWRERLNETVADPAIWRDGSGRGQLLDQYRSLSFEHWTEVARTYGVTHLVTPAEYPVDPIHESDGWYVYSLDAAGD